MAGPFTTPVAQSVPLENKDSTDNDFKSLNVQEGLEEIDFRRETKDPTGFLNFSESTISFDDNTLKFSITPTGSEFTYYIRGCAFVKTAQEDVYITNTSGVWVIYYDDTGTLTSVQADLPYDGPQIKVGILYWNAVTQSHTWFGDPRNNLSMNWGSRRRAHFTEGVKAKVNDFLIHDTITDGDGNSDAHAQMSMTDGRVYHEDAEWTIVDAAIPASPWEQKLENIANIPILYRQGAGNIWYKKPATDFALYNDGANTCFFNEETTPNNWTLTNCADNQFFAVYLYATIDSEEPVIGVLGTNSSNSPKGAIEQAMITPAGLPSLAFAFLKVLIFQTSVNFSNAPHARLFAVTDVIDILSTDRYMIQAFYGGNANTGRILEISPTGENSEDQPLLIPEDSFIRTITLQSTLSIGNNKSIGFFKSTDLVNPVFEVTVPVGGQKEHVFEVTESFDKGDLISVRVTNGNIQKPMLRFWIETTS